MPCYHRFILWVYHQSCHFIHLALIFDFFNFFSIDENLKARHLGLYLPSCPLLFYEPYRLLSTSDNADISRLQVAKKLLLEADERIWEPECALAERSNDVDVLRDEVHQLNTQERKQKHGVLQDESERAMAENFSDQLSLHQESKDHRRHEHGYDAGLLRSACE